MFITPKLVWTFQSYDKHKLFSPHNYHTLTVMIIVWYFFAVITAIMQNYGLL